jgi:branched-chain amino acid transport system substrate-binding protein
VETVNLESPLRYLTTLLFCCCFSLSAHSEILIGIAGPLSGQNAAFGNELRSGVAAAIATINAQGGINGEPLAIVEGDDACDAKRAIEVARTFVSRDVRMVVGHFCSSASLAAAPAYSNAGILMINPSVNAPDLTSKNLWNVLRLTGRDDAQADIAAARMKAEGQSSDVFLITDGQPDSAVLAKRFSESLPNAKIVTIKPGAIKLPDEPGLIVASTVYLALQPIDAADVANAIRKLNTSAIFYGPDLLQSESYGTRGEAAVDGTRITFLQDFVEIANGQKLNSLPQRDGVTVAAYAAVETFVAAAKANSVNDTRAISTWLKAGNAVPTIIGALRWNTSGDLQIQPYAWYRWQSGSLVLEN